MAFNNKNHGSIKTLRLLQASCLAALLTASPYTVAQPVTLNLKDADIAAVIATVSDITGKNFIVDQRVKGKVTIISARPMSKEEVYQVFLSLLEVNGFAAVPSGKVIKIIPDVNAKQSSTPVATDRQPGRGDEVVTRVIHVKNISATQLVPVLRPLSPQQGHMVAYPGTNALIISDRASNIERLAEIIERIDQPSDTADVEVITLRHAAASEVVRILNALDQEGRKNDPASASGITDRPVLIADERTNSLLVGGGQGGRLRLRALISHLDTPLQTSGNIRVVYLRYAKAKDLVPVLTGVASQVQDKSKPGGGAVPGGAPVSMSTPGSGINIQADESINALVVTAPQDVFQSLQSVISQLDVRRAQVLVEAVIVEVTSSRAAELGIQWGTFDQSTGSSKPIGLTNFNNGGAGSSIAAIGAAIATNTVPAIGAGLTFGLGQFNSGGSSFAALIRALEADGTSNILSTPTLLTMDNTEAEIVVGQNVPFITGSFTSPGTGGAATNPFQTIERKNVGITLKIKPQINEGNAIKLEIEQKVDSLSPSAVAGAADLVTNTRSIRTHVMVDDGKVIALGGLITDDLRESVQKVPLFGDLPLVGSLFRYKKNSKDKTNLMVFLHPVIMRDGELAERITHGKYEFMRARQLEASEKGMGILRHEEAPLLPNMQDMIKLPPPFETGNTEPAASPAVSPRE